jgi:hypothetical protein
VSRSTFRANHDLRQSFVFLDILAMQQPEAYISGIDTLLDESGCLGNDSTSAFLGEFVYAYAVASRTSARRVNLEICDRPWSSGASRHSRYQYSLAELWTC